ncbi:YigZ family protein [Metamycoplasma phocicerebrale]|uniref:YigZ family protein n=1 Tax=Metamycoplasma phocicerebrale TaxID=142649 RepID=A0A3Q9V871_9BACT|nr:YigZ family protein [Metamycoplasma phocicerebrale]AZZ65319.1 YigZ family protein [Metamycoplasma phocicerebrale]
MKLLEIKKSKFYPFLFNVSSKEEVKQIILKIKQEHKKAKHVVYAFIIEQNNTILSGFSDDNEPKGVAGRPLYNLLENKKIINKLIVIVRYFGGIELGKSNLLRAYLQAGKLLF